MGVIGETPKVRIAAFALQSNGLSDLKRTIVEVEVQRHGTGCVLQHHQVAIRIHQSDDAGQTEITSRKVIRSGTAAELRNVGDDLSSRGLGEGLDRARIEFP